LKGSPEAGLNDLNLIVEERAAWITLVLQRPLVLQHNP
jgi:hypothetical protein